MIPEQERLLLLVELIAHDMKIHRHLHFLEQSGLYVDDLRLSLDDKIFKLARIEDTETDEQLKVWYDNMLEKSIEIDAFRDKKKLLDTAEEILVELNNKRQNRS